MRAFKHSGTVTALVLAIGALTIFTAARDPDDLRIVNPPAAANPSDPPAPFEQPNRTADNFKLQRLAQGSDPLENPSGVITQFGLLNDTARTKTEPDQNLYLTFDRDLGGPTPHYHYGRHFLYQGHENGGGQAYVTRINLDVADPLHRISLLTPADPATNLTGFSAIDGTTWNPFSRTLLFTQEVGGSAPLGAAGAGVIEITPEWPPLFRRLDGILGKAGYEGVQLDDQGNILLVEDTGGVSVNVITGDSTSPKTAKQPNSFVYRFEPYHKGDLSFGGRLFALQVSIGGIPLVFHAADPVGDVFSDAQLKLHTPGTSWPTTWVLVHDTAVDGFADFDANLLAKAKKATPFKRPENAKYLPGSHFDTFFFCPTGDTDSNAGNQPALAARGAWGSIFRVHFPGRNAVGSIAIAVLGDADHAAFDNLTFADEETLLATEDRGDGLHDQLNKLDSVWAFDVVDHDRRPRRLIALGRDAQATAEDNEPTGLHVSDGAVSIAGLLGAHDPSKPAFDFQSFFFRQPWFFRHDDRFDSSPTRWFVTQQHGLNQLFEILPK
jgi:hypothetical protein